MQTLSTLIAGFVFYCKCWWGSVVCRKYEVCWDERRLTMSPLFPQQCVLSCKAIKDQFTGQGRSFLWTWRNPPGLPSWRLSDGHAHTPVSTNTDTQTGTRARTRRLSLAKAGRRKTLHIIVAQGMPCVLLYLFFTKLTMTINLDEWQKPYGEVMLINVLTQRRFIEHRSLC